MKTRIVVLGIVIVMSLYLPLTVYALEIIPQIFTEDIDEYNVYVQENDDLPVDFVTYRALSAFGSFHSFCSYDSPELLHDYYYVIGIQEDIGIVISINESKSLDNNLEIADLSQIEHNMLYIKEPKDCVIQSEGFIYQYYDCGMEKGKLASISWTIGNLAFTIGCSNLEFDKLSSNSLLSRMLSASKTDHISAKNEITQNIILDWLRNNIGMIIVVFIVLITSARLFIAIWQRYRRKNNSADL